MGTYYTSYDIQQSSNSVDIIINGLRGTSGNPVVQLRTWLNNSFVQWVEDIDTSWILNYPYTYTGLSSNTSYSFQIEIWSGSTVIDSFSGRFTTTGGGGGGTTPTYTVSTSGNTVYINILNADLSYNRIYTWLNDSQGGRVDYHSLSNTDNDSYTGLADGTYSVSVEYKDDNTDWIFLKNDQTGQEDTQFTIGSGPTPTGEYSYPWSDTANVTSISSIEAWRSGSAYEGWFFTFTFDQAGTLRLYSSNLNGSMQSYIGPVDNDYYPSNGSPVSYSDSAVGDFDFSWTGSVGDTLYLWVNSIGNSSYSFYLNASFSGGGGSVPTYTYSVSGNSIILNAQNKGNYLLSYIVRLKNDPNDQNHTLYYTNDLSYTASNLSWNTWYTINVGYSDAQWGTINWISSPGIDVQIGSQPTQQFQYTLISGITISNSNPNPIRISFSENNGVIVPITVSYNGTVTIYTETDQSSRMDDQAFLCTSRYASYDSAGVIPSTSPYYIKENDDSHGNGQFQMTIDNTNIGTNTYYLYIRGWPDLGIPREINTLLYATIPSGGYVYIYDGSTWRQAVPYIYDGSTWREAIPYVYDGSTWRECGG